VLQGRGEPVNDWSLLFLRHAFTVKYAYGLFGYTEQEPPTARLNDHHCRLLPDALACHHLKGLGMGSALAAFPQHATLQ
jgi:hypothetical protein